MTLYMKKGVFFTNCIDYCIHVIRPGRLGVSTLTIHAVRGHKNPTNLTEVRSFLRLRKVLRLLVPNLACVSVPLNEKLRKRKLGILERLPNEKITALKTLKPKFMEPPVLAFTRSQGNYTVHIEACYKQIGCMRQAD